MERREKGQAGGGEEGQSTREGEGRGEGEGWWEGEREGQRKREGEGREEESKPSFRECLVSRKTSLSGVKGEGRRPR